MLTLTYRIYLDAVAKSFSDLTVIVHWDSCLNSNLIILVFLKVTQYICKTQLSR